jgi:hypothetical protein
MHLANQSLNFRTASGIEQRYKSPTENIAEDINGSRQDPIGLGWLFDRGIEPWWAPASTWTPGLDQAKITALFGSRVDSIFVWAKQNTEQVYVLVESGGYLYYWLGNKGGIGVGNFYNDLVTIQTGRHIPKINEPGTQYIPYGNRLLIINGYDKPIWFYGRNRFRDFGFTLQTPAPEVLDIEPDYLTGTYQLQQGIAAPNFPQNSRIGIGDSTKAKFNNVSYKLTYITDSGSESPLSSLASVSWETIQGAEAKFGVMLKNLPLGGDGVVARRIYRTKNQKTPEDSGAADSTYYFVNQVNDNATRLFIDVVADTSLVDTAPSITDTSVISNGYAYGASWNGSLWMAGGSSNPTKIIYSKQGLPEQFGAFDYFDIGNTAGGAITGITPYYNNLIVFRQRAIDVVRVGNGGMYQISQITPEIGTTATNTAKLVPGVGLMFLSYDGLYVVDGGLDGGATVSVSKLTAGLSKETERINKAALPRACAVYSSKEREYWVHYTEQGHTYSSRGMVYHIDTGMFSLRHAIDDENDWLWAFSALAVDPTGNIIIGTQPYWLNGIFSNTSEGYLVGLHVWSGTNSWGKKFSYVSVGQTTYTYAVTDVALPTLQYETNWLDFGDNSMKHRVFNVECELISFGNVPLDLLWAVDSKWNFFSAGQQLQAQPEYVQTTAEDAVFGPNTGISKNYFTIGTSHLQEPKIIRIRWDVNTQLCTSFKFRLTQQGTPFHVLSWHVNYSTSDQLSLNQRAGTRKGNQ